MDIKHEQSRSAEVQYTDEDIRRILLNHVVKDVILKPDDFDEDDTFANIGVDSLDFTQLMIWCEESFAMVIDDEEVNALELSNHTTSFNQFVRFIQQTYKKQKS